MPRPVDPDKAHAAEQVQVTLNYAHQAISIADGKSRQDLDSEPQLFWSLRYLLGAVGEAIAGRNNEYDRLNSAFWPEPPYNQVDRTAMYEVRNTLFHEVHLEHKDLIWETVAVDLPALVAELEQLDVAAPSALSI